MTAQQLKNSILQMAVQGKLVPQDPSDEPASVLLQRIKAEKQELIKAGKIKKDKKSSEIFRGATHNLPYAFCEQIGKEIRDISDEIPFEIPDSWEWVRLGELCDIINGFTPLRSKEEFWNSKDIPWFTVEDIRLQGREITETKQFISKLAVSDNSNRILPVNSILLCCTASVGEYAIAKIPLTTNQQFNGLAIKEEYKEFFYYRFLYHIASTFKDTLIRMAGKTTFNFISVKKVSSILIPFPPFNEQHRIVAKIEELLPYIEKYGKAEEHLTALNTTFPEALKKTILQEAVHGKLVPQNPDDEPASVLLERIRAEKQALIKAGKIKKDKHESVIVTRDKIPYEIIDGEERCIADEVPFEIPDNWCWCRLGEIGETNIGLTYRPSDKTDSSGVLVLRSSNIQNGQIDYNDNVYISCDIPERALIHKGDILICARNGSRALVGKCALVDKDGMAFGAFMAKFSSPYNQYIKVFLDSPLFRQQLEGVKTETINQITQDVLKKQLIPFPPLAEQKRIVAKIEELMQYCDKL